MESSFQKPTGRLLRVQLHVQVRRYERIRDAANDKILINLPGNVTGAIFIQASKINDFKAKSQGGDSVTVLVDDSFQYGQKTRDPVTGRFLVFHDKGNKLYQVSKLHQYLSRH
jgi:hypothetical protein